MPPWAYAPVGVGRAWDAEDCPWGEARLWRYHGAGPEVTPQQPHLHAWAPQPGGAFSSTSLSKLSSPQGTQWPSLSLCAGTRPVPLGPTGMTGARSCRW